MVEFDGLKIAVACPSYRRPKCITAGFIPETRIYIDKSDEEAYRAANEGVGEVVVCEDGIQGNLPRVRNYILDHEFGDGADVVVMMDDDVSFLGWFKPEANGFGYKVNRINHDEFYNFVAYGTQLCNDWGFGMWGVNYNQDPMLYQHYLPFSTQKSAVGQFMVFTKNELRFDENLPLKEDYDMNIQQQNKYRGILTINFAFVKGDFGKLQGGTSIRRNHSAEFEQFKLFKKKWGSKIVRGTNQKSGIVKDGGSGKRKEYQSRYDFSHPIVRVPIDGV